MSTVIRTDHVNHNGNGYDDAGTDPDLVVARGVYVGGSEAGIVEGHSGATVYNYGNIYGGRYGENAQYDSSVVNHGSIRSNYCGVYAVSSLLNYGTIDGRVVGVFISGEGNIVNHGKITGSSESTTESSSAISGATFGPVTSGPVKVFNYGTLEGDYGVYLEVATIATSVDHITATLVNEGDIQGSAWLINEDTGLDHGQGQIINTGNIGGTVIGGRIINHGKIEGAVGLVNSDEKGYFDGRGGITRGLIEGDGNDVVHAGDDGESMFGERGHNFFYGGAGADTFDLGSYYANSFAGNASYIGRFDTSMDHLELSSSTLTSLHAGETPEFAIATHATDATDHLFFNPNNHWLYYDADGTGSGAAQAIGHFQAGTNLTASHLKVV